MEIVLICFSLFAITVRLSTNDDKLRAKKLALQRLQNERQLAMPEKEIKFLIAAISTNDRSFEYAGKTATAAHVSIKAFAKYEALKSSIKTTEDFIETIANTLDGKPYFLIEKDGKRELFTEWLRDKLKTFREIDRECDQT